MDRTDVAIFRQNLFRVSEPFVTDQAGALRRYRPFFVGRLRYGPGPAEAVSFALRDQGRAAWPGMVGQMVSRDPGPYLRLLAGQRRPALVHAHFGTDGVYALPLARALGVPLVTTFHGFDATLATAGFLLSPAWANYPLHRGALAREGALFVCVSRFIRDRVLALGFPPARTVVHYTGVDTGAIRPRDPAEEGRILLHVARLVAMKGTADLLRAFAVLPARHGDVSLAVIGNGERQRSLEALARALGIAGRVRFLGAQPHGEALRWMRRAAMLVLPSIRTRTGRTEGLGMVLLEAAATGVPIVGSTAGGIGEAVEDGRTGLLVPPGAPAALAQAITTLLDDPPLRARMGAAGRRMAVERFDLARQTTALEALYDRARGLPAGGGR